MTTGRAFRILGISQSKDEKAIKHAFAARAKECHPEDDPAGWAELNEAYRTALDYAAGALTDGTFDPGSEMDSRAAERKRLERLVDEFVAEKVRDGTLSPKNPLTVDEETLTAGGLDSETRELFRQVDEQQQTRSREAEELETHLKSSRATIVRCLGEVTSFGRAKRSCEEEVLEYHRRTAELLFSVMGTWGSEPLVRDALTAFATVPKKWIPSQRVASEMKDILEKTAQGFEQYGQNKQAEQTRRIIEEYKKVLVIPKKTMRMSGLVLLVIWFIFMMRTFYSERKYQVQVGEVHYETYTEGMPEGSYVDLPIVSAKITSAGSHMETSSYKVGNQRYSMQEFTYCTFVELQLENGETATVLLKKESSGGGSIIGNESLNEAGWMLDALQEELDQNEGAPVLRKGVIRTGNFGNLFAGTLIIPSHVRMEAAWPDPETAEVEPQAEEEEIQEEGDSPYMEAIKETDPETYEQLKLAQELESAGRTQDENLKRMQEQLGMNNELGAALSDYSGDDLYVYITYSPLEEGTPINETVTEIGFSASYLPPYIICTILLFGWVVICTGVLERVKTGA